MTKPKAMLCKSRLRAFIQCVRMHTRKAKFVYTTISPQIVSLTRVVLDYEADSIHTSVTTKG